MKRFISYSICLALLLVVHFSYGQKPANDSCSNASFIPFGSDGFQTGLFQSDSFSMDSATKQVGEFFHSSLVSSGNDKKTIWFAFYLPTRRGINLELKQNANAIATVDCGFTTFKSDSCFPGSLEATDAKLTALSQFGSSFHPCMDPGWYMVQVSSKTRAMGKVFLEITSTYPYESSSVLNGTYDHKDSAYDFGDQVVGKVGATSRYVDFEVGCYSMSDSLEFYKGFGANYKEYNQSAWFVFQANQDADNTQLKFSERTSCNRNDSFAIRIFSGDVRNNGSLTLIDSSLYDWTLNNTCYTNCSDVVKDLKCMFDSGQFYSVQVIYHENNLKRMRFQITDQTSEFDSGYNQPVIGGTRDLGVVSGNNSYKAGFSCGSYIASNKCGNANDSIVQLGAFDYNLSQWFTFEIAEQSKLVFSASNISSNSNNKRYNYLGLRLFQDTVDANCSSIDTNNLIYEGTGNGTKTLFCLEPGIYTFQMLGTDTVRDYSNWECYGSMHLGGDYALNINQSPLPAKNRYSMSDTGDVDTVNNMDLLPNYTTVNGGLDTISCFDGPLPEEVCDTTYTKVMYRTFTIGDADGDGNADSGLLYINSLQNVYRGNPYYDYNAYHKIYKGNAKTLRFNQNIAAYPDTFFGLTSYTNCLPQNATNGEVCIEPGEYTLVSFFDSLGISRTERPTFRFFKSSPKFNTHSNAEFVDSIKNFGLTVGEYDTFSCTENRDTIDGVSCGNRNSYHVFYLDSQSIVSVTTDYYSYYYYNKVISLFKGDIRNGKSGLSLYQDGLDWSCVRRQSTIPCKPMEAGWYTVMVSYNSDAAYDSMFHAGSSRQVNYNRHRVEITTSALTVVPRKFDRPYKSANVDSLINSNNSLHFDTNYSPVQGMTQNLRRLDFPLEQLNCELDTPITYFPKNKLCDTATTDIVFYSFSIKEYSYVKILGNASGGTWKVKLYDFDVRKDSALLATEDPIQDCNYTTNHVEFCNLEPGEYTLVYFCKRTEGVSASVRPTMYIDSVMHSKYDHAKYAYDFSRIPGDNLFYDGKVGEVHPQDTSLPASHDIITCRTGAAITDPTHSFCYGYQNPFVYAKDTNNAFYPYDSARYTLSNNSTVNPWSYPMRRNIWYSFVVGGRGNVTVNLNGINSSFINTGNATRFSIFESDEDGNLSMQQLRDSGRVDSTIADGLTYITEDYTYCYYSSDKTATFGITACDEVKPRRYYVLVEVDGYYHSSVPNINQNIWLDIKYDSLYIPQVKYDYYSNSNVINGRNDQNLLVNGDFENSSYGWTNTKANWSFATTGITAKKNTRSTKPSHNSTYANTLAETEQKVDVSNYTSFIQSGTATANLSGYLQSIAETNVDEGRFVIEYLNQNDSVLYVDSSAWIANVGSWQQVSHSKLIPAGTVNILVKLQANKPSTNYYYDVYFDDFDLRIQVPNDTIGSTLKENTLYKGDLTYFSGATLDSTDYTRTYYNNSCSDPAVAGTVWYKFEVQNTGFIHYNYLYSSISGSTVNELYSYDNNRIRLYRSTIAGDSLYGLELVPPTGSSTAQRSLLVGRAQYACVSPGTYYIQINKCNTHACSDYVYPQIAFDFHTADFCFDAEPLSIDTLEKVNGRVLVNCHTIGTDFGEDGTNMGCLFGPAGYKSSWFVVDYTDTTKVDLEFQLTEYTNALATEIRYRTFYGSCNSLTPAPCNNNALTSFVLDCVRKGTYYIQIVTPENATGEIELSVEAKENLDSTCNPIDVERPLAAFYYNNICPENVVEFINTSTQGDSIRYLWDFGFGGNTDTSFNPVYPFPVSLSEDTFTVKLVVTNFARNLSDSLELQVEIPSAIHVEIANNDTLLCIGDSVTLTGNTSRGKAEWSTGDTTNSITVKSSGIYYYGLVDKPNLMVNGSFESAIPSADWQIRSGDWRRTTSGNYNIYDGNNAIYSYYPSNASTGLTEIFQDVDISFDSLEVDSGLAKISLKGIMRGYSNYPDLGQVSLEYYDASNNLLSVYRSGYFNDRTNWASIVHSRTVPKNTRSVKVVLQVNKLTTNSRSAFVFFDALELKMRSACDYKDSVQVLIGAKPILALPQDTFLCYGDTFDVSPSITYDNPYIALDSMNNGTVGVMKGNAKYNAFDKYVELTDNSTSYQNGQIEYVDSTLLVTDSFDLSFEYYSGGNDYYALWFYMFNHTTPTGEDFTGGGYSINLDANNSNNLQYEWNNSRLSTAASGVDLDDRKWHFVEIKYRNQYIEVYFDGKLIGSYLDGSTRTQAGFKFGLGARSYYNDYWVRNFQLSKNNPEKVVIPPTLPSSIDLTWNDASTSFTQRVYEDKYFTVQGANAYGCVSNVDTIQIDVDTVVKTSLLPAGPYCENDPMDTMEVTRDVGNFNATAFMDTAGLFQPRLAGAGTHKVLYMASDAMSGCTMSDSINVVVLEGAPEDTIQSSVLNACADSVNLFTRNPGLDSFNYTWKLMNAFPSDSAGVNLYDIGLAQFHTVGPNLVTLVIENRTTNCASTDSSLIYVSCTNLPIELLEFNVNKLSESLANISWITAMEENVHYFDVLRRHEEEDSFYSIGHVMAEGNSNRLIRYNYLDDLSLVKDGIIYYQLKEVDFNDYYYHTKVKYIAKENILEQVPFVFTNPIKNTLKLDLNGCKMQTISYKIINSIGELQKIGTINSSELEKVELDVKGLPVGTYYFQLLNLDLALPFVIQR